MGVAAIGAALVPALVEVGKHWATSSIDHGHEMSKMQLQYSHEDEMARIQRAQKLQEDLTAMRAEMDGKIKNLSEEQAGLREKLEAEFQEKTKKLVEDTTKMKYAEAVEQATGILKATEKAQDERQAQALQLRQTKLSVASLKKDDSDINEGKVGSGTAGVSQIQAARGGVKILTKRYSVAMSATEQKQFEADLRILTTIRHPSLAVIVTAEVAKGSTTVMSELVVGNDMRMVVHQMKIQYDSDQLLVALADIASGMTYLHANNVVHGKLKLANLILYGYGRIKLVDYGVNVLANVATRRTTTTSRSAVSAKVSLAGQDRLISMEDYTLQYHSPQRLVSQEHSKEDDVYAFGIALYEMLTGLYPYDARNFASTRTSIIEKGARPVFPAKWKGSQMSWLCSACWHHNSKARPSFSEIKELVASFKNVEAFGKIARPLEERIRQAGPTPQLEDPFRPRAPAPTDQATPDQLARKTKMDASRKSE